MHTRGHHSAGGVSQLGSRVRGFRGTPGAAFQVRHPHTGHSRRHTSGTMATRRRGHHVRVAFRRNRVLVMYGVAAAMHDGICFSMEAQHRNRRVEGSVGAAGAHK